MDTAHTPKLPEQVLKDLGKIAECFESPTDALQILIADFRKKGATCGSAFAANSVSAVFMESQLKAHARRQAVGIPGRVVYLMDALAPNSSIPRSGVKDLGGIEDARYHGSWQD